MGFLASIFAGPLIKTLVGELLGPVEGIFKAYFAKEISREQMVEKLQEAILAAFASVEKEFYNSLTQTYTAFIQAAAQNKTLSHMIAVVCYSQLAVLIWHQFVIPYIIFMQWAKSYPSSGATVDWAYALIALCLGAPALASRIGPAKNWAADTLSRLGRK